MKTWKFLSVILLILLAACQTASPAARLPAPTVPPTPAPVSESIEPTLAPTSAPSPTAPAPSATPGDALAVKTVQDYFAALQNGDAQSAANLLSNFSLVVDGITRGEAAGALRAQIAQGSRWSDLKIMDTRPFDDKTTLVHLTYQQTTRDPKTGQTTQTQQNEQWPLRLENGEWRYNRGNLIDFRTLQVTEQTTGGLTVKPRLLARYPDHIRLTLLVQNRSNDPIVLGQVNEVMAAFVFGGQTIEAEKTRFIFDRLRSYPNTAIDVKGLFTSYPDAVMIRQWKNVKAAPWFTFNLAGQ